MEPSDAVTELLTAIQAQQDVAGRPVEFADQLASAVAGLVEPAEVCLVLYSPAAGRVEFGTTSAVISQMVETDEVLGEGPISAALQSRVVERWVDDAQPRPTLTPFTSVAAHQDAACQLIAVPVTDGLGALTVAVVYKLPHRAAAPIGKLWDLANGAGRLVGTHLSLLTRTPSADRGQNVDWTGPWASRDVLHQAAGSLMAREVMSAEDARALIRARAFSTGASLVQVSRAVVERRADLIDDD